MKNLFIKIMERSIRSLRTRYIILKDKAEVFFGFRHTLLPPKRYNYINIGENEDIAKEFFNYFITLGGLKPSYHVLEIGCGFGRMAIPLTEFLDKEGSYHGLDIIKDGINWCKSNFTPRFCNFKFQHINVLNIRYNKNGNILASDCTFPFKDNSIDFVYLTSVFTHMYPDAIKNYLNEIYRVLKPGAKSLITFYILNDTSLNNIEQNKGAFNFNFDVEDYKVEDLEDPLYQIAFNEKLIRNLYKGSGLIIEEPIHFGSWSGRTDHLSFQDVILSAKC